MNAPLDSLTSFVTALAPEGTGASVIEANSDVFRVRFESGLEAFILTWYPTQPEFIDLSCELHVCISGDTHELHVRRQLDIIQQDATFVKGSLWQVQGSAYNLTLCVEQTVGRSPEDYRLAVARALSGLRDARTGLLAA